MSYQSSIINVHFPASYLPTVSTIFHKVLCSVLIYIKYILKGSIQKWGDVKDFRILSDLLTKY